MSPSHSLSTPVGTHLQSQARVGTLRWPPMAARPLLNKITDAGVSVCNSLSTRILLGRRSSGGAGSVARWEPPQTLHCCPRDTCGCSCSCAGAARRRPPRTPSSAGSAGPGSWPRPPGSSAGTPSGHPVGSATVTPRAQQPRGHGGERAQALTSGQNSITSRYGVTSAHWARHCSRLVCWRALRGAQQWGSCCTLPVLALGWEGWWQPPRRHRPSCARRMAQSPRSHHPAAGSGYQHVPAPGMCHKGTFVQLC